MTDNQDPIGQARQAREAMQAEMQLVSPLANALGLLLQRFGPHLAVNACVIVAIVRAKHAGLTKEQLAQVTGQLWDDVHIEPQEP